MDLYGSDATLFAAHGDVRVNVGADLWASDVALYAAVSYTHLTLPTIRLV